MEIKVLDDGFVRFVDKMGNDGSVVQAARVSYGEGTKTPSDDTTLIRYLFRHRHTTPFEMAEIKFHVRVPMDCWRQWIRHRTANVNEYSTRYSEAIDSMQKTSKWRPQSKTNKQGSEEGAIAWPDYETMVTNGDLLHWESRKDDATPDKYLSDRERSLHNLARIIYQERLDCGVAREQARKDLPLSNYTEAYWKIDLHNLFHFLSLRMDKHAQSEIAEYATAIFQLTKEHFPICCEAFEDYRLNGMYLTRMEVDFLRHFIKTQTVENNGQVTGREFAEFQQKLKRLLD